MKLAFTLILILYTLTSLATVSSSFSCSMTKGCSPFVVNLTDNSIGNITNRHWDFGNGNTSTLMNPSVEYYSPGIYTIKLYVFDGIDIDSSSMVITVFSPPTVSFTTDITTTCPQQVIHFTNHVTAGSAPVHQFVWDFGNGITNNNENTTYEYPASGIYNVTLVAQDTNGCDGHLTMTSHITIWPLPIANYIDSPSISCATSGIVQFTNQSSGNGLSYLWNFGDNSFSNNQDPTHQYAAGKYKATLIVTSSNGCVDSLKQNISVINLKANFTASDTNVCIGQSIRFTDQSPMPGTRWQWYFGDGSGSSDASPTKIYSQPGTYSVTFKVYDAICGDVSTKVNYINVISCFSPGFSANARNSCSVPFTVTFTSQVPSGGHVLWYFGDGGTSTAQNPIHTYTSAGLFTVSLTATDSNGVSITTTQRNLIGAGKPVVNFKSDTLFCPGTNVQFINLTNNGVRYLWNFGDGDTSIQISPSHIYHSYGYYTVSLTAWDSLGCDSTVVKSSFMHIDSFKIGLDVNEKFSTCPPLVSQFSSFADQSQVTFRWYFGDGYTDTAANPTHVYFQPGIYTVKLVATSAHCGSSTLIDSNLIKVQGPSGIFTVNPRSGCIPLEVNFSGSVSSNTKTISCDLGDGTLYNDSLSFNYTYTTARNFHPSFILTDYTGCTIPFVLDSITTHPLPSIDIRDTAICAGRKIQIATMGNHSQWGEINQSLCDTCINILGQCDTCSHIILVPTDTTTYLIQETNQYGCTVNKTFNIMVDPMPVLKPQDTIKICKNVSVQINAVSNAYSVTWSPATYLNGNKNLKPVSTPVQDITYQVIAANQLGCTVTELVPVEVYQSIPVTVSDDTAVCGGTIVQLNASVTDTFFHDVTYTWAPSADLSANNTSDPLVTIGSVAETFTVTVASGACPPASASVTVRVNPAANVSLPAPIVTTPHTETSISPVSGDITSYSWSAKNDISCAECATMTIAPTESQVVYLEGKNQYGCFAADSMMIRIVDCDPASIFVANIFTPNGDGVNDMLYVRSKALAEMEYFQIFNRWGAIVFQTNNMSAGWDGFINGKLAEAGTYVYQVKGKCESGYDVASNGTVTLVR